MRKLNGNEEKLEEKKMMNQNRKQCGKKEYVEYLNHSICCFFFMSVMERRYEECGSALRCDTVEGTFAAEKPRGGAGELPFPLQGKAIMREQREGGEVLASGLIIWEDGAISELTAVDTSTCFCGDHIQCPIDTCCSCRVNPFIEHVSSTAKDQWINATALPKDVEVPFWRMVQFPIKMEVKTECIKLKGLSDISIPKR
ncbi:uncharacterized protein MONOS_14458 [Monocercomonoides exilis]|uniref:uncharacterized protein n=1 Tax=Monocercomonoides exilis TaxID=2049356 RepID=UPI0035594318|nr:hypothetical protein MONOS_14458 [Monocercomonoides exilis]|eukprot:MONOS_14458.1-p1 / transcript=MONOS_14458.1 / gene=MONOS_14458 / organism=Monocercomonoides_exilis_PA203 / gene_product=unspecified product / transcript_product=unspecified product / location=Mono_scaffold01005:23173-23893(+) / protein_length=199 / sequence_SO=supercontig / SO=protein_coding / is_pseudo=false